MPYDEELAERVREVLDQRRGVIEMKMFGGIGFMLRGNMAVGVHGDDLIARVDPAEHETLLAKPNARLFDITGRPMAGWLLVAKSGLKTAKQLRTWVDRSADFAMSLPPKPPKKRKPRRGPSSKREGGEHE